MVELRDFPGQPHDQSGNEDVGNRQRDEVLPTQVHQLVVAEAGDGPPDPHEEEDEEEDLAEEEDRSQDAQDVRVGNKSPDERHVITTEVKGRDHRGGDEHVDVFGEEIEAEFHRAVFGVIAAH